MHTDLFRELPTDSGPFVSVYVDDSHNTENATHSMELRWRSLREQLESDGAPTAALDHIQTALLDGERPVGVSGRGLVATAERVVLDQQLIRPPTASVARYSTLPFLVPLVTHARDVGSHMIAVVDHRGADIQIVHGDDVAYSETVAGEGHPVHKATGAETPGYGDPQPRAEEQARQNIRDVVDRLTSLVDRERPDVLFVVGESRSVSDLTAQLPQRIEDVVVNLGLGARGSVADSEISGAVDAEWLRRHNRVLAEVTDRFRAEQGRSSGLAVEGLTAVCGALRAGEVQTLLIGDIDDATVVVGEDLMMVAPSPENLSELGAPPNDVVRADEALPMVAVCTHSDLVSLDERLAPKDGIAALLRYAPRTSAGG
ncbi:Rv2629 family ribosome hibernation factor [Gordonia aquimaris]|uniref:Peptide chain release factor 1 n=1 Tax=Gordonia aquimaris TaxID=2984863 RepID=A0A9X3D7J8_9ACTN|nr:hypothetical protein [Gordonia aquimaris]MCX2966624.1 hypothetical protein [Gordonia aquimaris]